MNCKMYLAIILITYSDAKGIFHFKFISYHNEDGKGLLGLYCDNFSKCDMYSIIRIEANKKIITWDKSHKAKIINNNVLFDDMPYTYNVTLDNKPKIISTYVYIYDYDVYGKNDLIDIILIRYFNETYKETWYDAHYNNEVSKVYLRYTVHFEEIISSNNETRFIEKPIKLENETFRIPNNNTIKKLHNSTLHRKLNLKKISNASNKFFHKNKAIFNNHISTLRLIKKIGEINSTKHNTFQEKYTIWIKSTIISVIFGSLLVFTMTVVFIYKKKCTRYHKIKKEYAVLSFENSTENNYTPLNHLSLHNEASDALHGMSKYED
ncbi:hypothetical protein A3Q56_05243 [Intoshia linei]|uniref:Uncharacterized protein n=1 Tax=Intoshia linei TaxID=1819745 RepID=A0A177B086_9BILA|nr:hypothetical protein A3Q56_05243 [Intoshia linei]